jgi:hypothetical protein
VQELLCRDVAACNDTTAAFLSALRLGCPYQGTGAVNRAKHSAIKKFFKGEEETL